MGARPRPVPGAGLPDGFAHLAGRRARCEAPARARDAALAVARTRPATACQSQFDAWRRLQGLSGLFRRSGARQARSRLVSTTIDLSDVQGNILRGYRRALVRHLILEISD